MITYHIEEPIGSSRLLLLLLCGDRLLVEDKMQMEMSLVDELSLVFTFQFQHSAFL